MSVLSVHLDTSKAMMDSASQWTLTADCTTSNQDNAPGAMTAISWRTRSARKMKVVFPTPTVQSGRMENAPGVLSAPTLAPVGSARLLILCVWHGTKSMEHVKAAILLSSWITENVLLASRTTMIKIVQNSQKKGNAHNAQEGFTLIAGASAPKWTLSALISIQKWPGAWVAMWVTN